MSEEHLTHHPCNEDIIPLYDLSHNEILPTASSHSSRSYNPNATYFFSCNSFFLFFVVHKKIGGSLGPVRGAPVEDRQLRDV